jgi:hypothetical protein
VHPAGSGERDDVLLELDADFVVREAVRLGDETGLARRFDDVRLFEAGDELHASVLIQDSDSDTWTRAGVVRIADGVYGELRLLQPQVGYSRQGLAPIETEDGMRVLAWWEPTEVLHYELGRRTFAQESLRLASHVAERFWSGSQGVRVPGGFLFLVNESVAREDRTTMTLSRFALIDDRFQLTAISPQCFLADRGRDMASGLARQGDRLIAGFTSASHGAVLATMGLAAVMDSLIPAPAPGRYSAERK